MPSFDTVYVGFNAATMVLHRATTGPIKDAAIAVENGRIAWLGPASELTSPHGHHR